MRNSRHAPTKPYIGITDFTDASQVRAMRKTLDETGTSYNLGVGVMMSYKTLRGQPTKWAKVFPPKKSIANIFVSLRGVFNILHYADYENVSRPSDLIDAYTFGGSHIHAMQFDMVWPRRESLKLLRDEAPGIAMILQINGRAMEECGNDPNKVAERLPPYRAVKCLDYVLLDKSMGQGKGMDAELLLTYIDAIKQRLPSLGIVVAGGLGPTSMHLLDPILAKYSNVSIDAQGQLRPSKDALDPIDWNMAGEYLRQAGALLR